MIILGWAYSKDDRQQFKNEFWKGVPEEEGPLKSRGTVGKTKCGMMALNCSIRKKLARKRERSEEENGGGDGQETGNGSK